MKSRIKSNDGSTAQPYGSIVYARNSYPLVFNNVDYCLTVPREHKKENQNILVSHFHNISNIVDCILLRHLSTNSDCLLACICFDCCSFDLLQVIPLRKFRLKILFTNMNLIWIDKKHNIEVLEWCFLMRVGIWLA